MSEIYSRCYRVLVCLNAVRHPLQKGHLHKLDPHSTTLKDILGDCYFTRNFASVDLGLATKAKLLVNDERWLSINKIRATLLPFLDGRDNDRDAGSEANSLTRAASTYTEQVLDNLQTDPLLLALRMQLWLLSVPSLREIVDTTPKRDLRVVDRSHQIGDTIANKTKTSVERITTCRWDWWPLHPCIPDMASGVSYLEWKVSKTTQFVTLVLNLQSPVVRECTKNYPWRRKWRSNRSYT